MKLIPPARGPAAVSSDHAGLQAQLDADGYLLIRGLVPREKVLRAMQR